MLRRLPTEPSDLTECVAAISAGRHHAQGLLESALVAANQPANAHTWIRRFDDQARATACAVDAMHKAGAPLPALGGLAVSIKDLFDVAGQPTTGGSAAMHDAGSATGDAPVVARLRQAGAALIGHTNLSEFAFSGVGINPHHGTPENPATARLDPDARVPGGSTSGGAVSVATGAAWAALGSDTGGSIRIPAALQGLVGFKCTARLVPTAGCIPLSSSLDTACAITRSVRDAVRVHEVLAARRLHLDPRPLSAWRLALPRAVMLDALEPAVAQTLDHALERLRRAGARIEDIDLPELMQAAALQRGGGLPAAESWAWHRQRMDDRGASYDPRVALRIRRGEALTAADYIDLQNERRQWIARVEDTLDGFDALLSPTLPIVAPRLQPLLDSDEAFFAANALLLRNPSLVNLLDGCAITLPCSRAADWPVGLMAWGPAMADDRVLAVALAIEHALSGDA